jgi:predicted neuraminidase
VERSTDNAKTWTKFGPITVSKEMDAAEKPANNPPAGAPGYAAPDKGPRKYEGIIQPSIVELGDKHLRLYARSRTLASKIAYADSFDDGATWTQAKFLDMPNNNSGIDAVRLKDGRIVMIYNDTTIGRTPLNLAVSRDGLHFRMFKTLESTEGQYSYPAIIEAADGGLEMTWTWKRLTIKYEHLPLADVPEP